MPHQSLAKADDAIVDTPAPLSGRSWLSRAPLTYRKTEARLHTGNGTLRALPPVREWQARAVSFAHGLLLGQGAAHMYLCAPTGTGKSRAIFEIVEALNLSGVHYLMVGMDAIMRQHRLSFLEYGCKLVAERADADELLTPSGQRIIIETWQGLAAMARRLDPVEPCGFLIFDECHVGGSNEENVSFPNIISHLDPAKRLYVSATIQTASENLLGQKAGHTFVYPLLEAYADRLLNPVDLVEVHTGTMGKIARVEQAYGRSIEQLEELSANDLEGLAKALRGRKVTIAKDAVTSIVRHRHDVMMDLYLSNHEGQQAIFFSPSIQAAEDAMSRFNTKGRVQAEVVHSGLRDAEEVIEQFRLGRITVLFVVGMLQEGFDMPALALAFDCRFYRRWNPARIARFIQKIGRLMRMAEGKPMSRYYYARDITDYYRSGDVDLPDDLGVVAPVELGVYELSDEEFAAGAATAAVQLLLDGEATFAERPSWLHDDFRVSQGEVECLVAGGEAIRTVATELYMLKAVDDGKVRKSVSFETLFGSAAAKKKMLLGMDVGSPRPPKRGGALGVVLSQYTSPSSDSYDAEFDVLIRARHPEWFTCYGTESSSLKKREMLRLPVGSPRPKQRKGELGGVLACYLNQGSRSYDAEFDAAIRARHPTWFRDPAADKKAELLAVPPGADRPHQKNHPLGAVLSAYTLPKSPSFDAEFNNLIRSRQPHWFERRGAAKKRELLSMPIDSPRPKRRSTLGIALSGYTVKNSSAYDSEFDAAIRERQPQWFRK